jgi:hypothetical protein
VSGHGASAQRQMTVEFLEKGLVILVKMAKRIDQQRNW